MLLLIAAFAVGLFVHDVSPELTVDPITQTSAADVASSAADVLTAADVPTAAVASSANVLPANAAPIDALSSAFDVEFNFAARPEPLNVVWVAAHVETPVWSTPGADAEESGLAYQWAPLQVVGEARSGRLPIWDPSERRNGWVQAADVGPVDPSLVGTAYLPPIGRHVAWSGAARVTMYTCVELGGCAATASGLWPTLGMVAVDPAVIPLGSLVWVQGLGTFLAADTGSLVRGAHLDVYSLSYDDAIDWGVQERTVLVYAPE